MIRMQQILINDSMINLSFLVGNARQIQNASSLASKEPFDSKIIDLLDQVSHVLLENREARKYPDVVTFGFWIRKASVLQMKERVIMGNLIRLGRGLVFHVAPSNVAVNFAYSLAAALLCGNANIIKAPSRDFEQVTIISDAFQKVLSTDDELKPYINIVRYGHEQEINDAFSAMCDVRVIWGGDETIHQFRRSPMKPRAAEVTFADRYSIAYIEAEQYLALSDKKKAANDFYNDTYLTDQNACTSPRIVVWSGSAEDVGKAKDIFWKELHALVKGKYIFQDIFAIDKLQRFYCMASERDDISACAAEDNLITRIKVKHPDAELMKWKCHAGFFFEYDCKDVMELRDLCDNTACQTVSYLGQKEHLNILLASGIKGVDRIVPIGSTMDFDLIWDGCNLVERFTRIVGMR